MFAYQHGQIGDTSIYKKIDHLLVFQEVLPSIQHSGFLPWGAVIASDHRAGFLDLDTETLFGTEDNLKHSSSRTLHTKYPKQTKKYREEVLKKFKKEHVFKGMKKLTVLAKSKGRWSQKMNRKFDVINVKAMHIILQAEKNCVQTFRYHISLSLPLMRASKAIQYWNLKVSLAKGKKSPTNNVG